MIKGLVYWNLWQSSQLLDGERAQAQVEQAMIILIPKSNQERGKTARFRAWERINEVYVASLILSVIYLVMGLYEGTLLMVEGVIIGALGIMLFKETSRAAAILLISIGLISSINGVVSTLGVADMGERNVLLALIVMLCGVRALKATLLIRGTPTLADGLKRIRPHHQ